MVVLIPLPSHCNTCKVLSGSTFTLNQIIPADALQVTKGGDKLGKYTYKGDSGTFPTFLQYKDSIQLLTIPRQECLLLLLPQLHLARVPRPGGARRRQDCAPHWTPHRGHQKLRAGRADLRQRQAALGKRSGYFFPDDAVR